ncbi:MAG TPA: SDR family NAD(P)-dependent oxidoreductase [Acidimicrobiales bacterium]|nr:SDR family NAD(P)-dependent oxidoreductase [Acidimicrobiales bacterium]
MAGTSDLSGRSAIVTGAGSGIGAAIAHRLVNLGARVILADIDAERAGVVAEACVGPGSATAARLDVSDAEAVKELVAKVAADHGSVDMLFNNAGIGGGR